MTKNSPRIVSDAPLKAALHRVKRHKIAFRDIHVALTRAVLNAIEKWARLILYKYPRLDEFVMGMGTCMFTTKAGETFWPPERRYTKALGIFIAECDEVLVITGVPMRFTATGRKITNW